MRIPLLAALSLLALAPPVSAQTPAPTPADKYRDYTPQQIAALPEIERLNQVPTRYIFAAQGYDDPVGFRIVHSMKLQALMYPALDAFDEAVKQFQRDLGAAPTGALTVSQIAELTYRNGVVKLGRAELPNTVRAVTLRDDYASAQGSWAAVEGALAWPINQVRIRCDPMQGVCEELVTSVVVPGRESWEMNYLIMTSTDRYQVTRWRGQQVEAMRVWNCRYINLTIRSDGEVTRALGEPLGPTEHCEDGVTAVDATAPPPDDVKLVDGGEVMREEYRGLQRLALSLMSGAFQQELTTWRANAPPRDGGSLPAPAQ
jgi:hypothetical protein